jgi:hypothetical protein
MTFPVLRTAAFDSSPGSVAAFKGAQATTRVPDVPFGSVCLDLQDGSKGLIRNSESLCGAHKIANVVMAGQNGKSVNRHVSLRTSCSTQASQKRKAHTLRVVGSR